MVQKVVCPTYRAGRGITSSEKEGFDLVDELGCGGGSAIFLVGEGEIENVSCLAGFPRDLVASTRDLFVRNIFCQLGGKDPMLPV